MDMSVGTGIRGQSTEWRRWILAAFVIAVLVAVAAAVINPIGYIGAGADDEQYLAAARCWVAHSAPCIPNSHWWTRWPAFAPVAAWSMLLGESRFSVGLGPCMWWALALVSLGYVGDRWFGWRAAAIAVALLGSTPMFAVFAFDPSADLPELALQLAALAAATMACRRQSAATALLAGIIAGCALQARDTSFLFFGGCSLAWFRLDGRRRKVLLWAIPGAAIPIAAEMLAYAAAMGDPFARFRLAMGHTNIPTSELPRGFHSARGPVLNPDFMRSWKREVGITIWWPIDPWLNLLASPRSATILGTGLASVAFLGRQLTPTDRHRATTIMIGAAVIAFGLVYVLAVDPKPRMFMSLYAAVALVAGAAISAGLRSEARFLAATLLLLPILLGLRTMSQYPATAQVERRSLEWILRLGPDIEVDPGAASYLTLLPQARALPLRGAGRRYLLATSAVSCEKQIDRRDGSPNGRVIDEMAGPNPRQGVVCLFEYLPVRPSVRSPSGGDGAAS